MKQFVIAGGGPLQARFRQLRVGDFPRGTVWVSFRQERGQCLRFSLLAHLTGGPVLAVFIVDAEEPTIQGRNPVERGLQLRLRAIAYEGAFTHPPLHLPACALCFQQRELKAVMHIHAHDDEISRGAEAVAARPLQLRRPVVFPLRRPNSRRGWPDAYATAMAVQRALPKGKPPADMQGLTSELDARTLLDGEAPAPAREAQKASHWGAKDAEFVGVFNSEPLRQLMDHAWALHQALVAGPSTGT